MSRKSVNLFLLSMVFCSMSFAQKDSNGLYAVVDYNSPKTYIVGGVEISGTNYYDKSVLLVLAGIQPGQKIRIPSDEVTKTINNLWKQKLFDDIKIKVQKIEDEKIWLEIQLREKPRLSTFSIKGLRKGKAEDLRTELTMTSGIIITENLLKSTEREVKKFFTDKSRPNASVKIEQESDNPSQNTAKLKLTIDQGQKIKIYDITFSGNSALTEKQIRGLFKNTKRQRRLFAKSRFMEEEYNDDKQKIIDKYLSLGYRDIQIVSDSVWQHNLNSLQIHISIFEGRKYFFRNLKFVGNTKYSEEKLKGVLNIKSGTIYDQSQLDEKLNMSQAGLDISTIYMDDGYLFFRIEPVEVLVENDSIDLEIRIFEGEQARINKVTVKGNTKTSDHVILRELRTKPGQLFSRSDITRSLRELASIGYFNPEALGVNPVPNPNTGTVDIEYKVEERANDQIELSGGWGAGMIVGTLGLSLNNFSARKLFTPKYWNPIPSGDGQRISLRAQTSGTFYQSYSASFSEPWLGGKRPNSFSFSIYHSRQSNGYTSEDSRLAGLYTTGMQIGLGKRLKFPDDYFTLQYQLSFQQYDHQYSLLGVPYISSIGKGLSNNISFKVILSRNSTDQIIYPRSGSNISLSLQFSPPYSLFGVDVSQLNDNSSNEGNNVNLRWLEFHKWKFDASFFNRIMGNLVFMTRVNFGAIGSYNSSTGITPFDRFWLGGSGLTGFSLDGRELIALRGYQDNTLTPMVFNSNLGLQQKGGTVYNRYTMELRYPVSLNPQATVFPLLFAEAGGDWSNFRDFNPFKVYRSYGLGVRIFLPMFGMIGLDYGWGIDDVPLRIGANGGNFHFLIGQQF